MYCERLLAREPRKLKSHIHILHISQADSASLATAFEESSALASNDGQVQTSVRPFGQVRRWCRLRERIGFPDRREEKESQDES